MNTADRSRAIVEAALQAATVADAQHVQQLIATAFGGRHLRPVGDKWNNHGLMSTSGSFDLKLIENVTNMQDAVIERHALQRFGTAADVPYSSPHAASDALFAGMDDGAKSRLATVEFRESDPPTGKNKRLTAVFRDAGCGLQPAAVPKTIFGLGGSHKAHALFLQGAFGLGGAMTLRNANAAVLVSRRAPELLADGEADVITIAVVEWEQDVKGATAYYLVHQPWQEAGDAGDPWSCPAADYPDFEPGTHLALISYRVEGFHRRREGDARSFDVVTNTRLYEPVLPIRWTNMIARGDQRSTTIAGLAGRLERTGTEFNQGDELLPFHHGGTTYHLPVRYVLFGKNGESGDKRRWVAHDHTVLFTSNGQVHHHWTPEQFKSKAKKLNKLKDRILVVVETDALPISVRTNLFTADRSDLVRGDAALRLEEEVRSFLDDWGALVDENNALLREALRGDNDQPTLQIARQIARALDVRGFQAGGGPGGGGAGEGGGRGGGHSGGSRKPIPLHPDPTRLDGPDTVRAVIGRTRSITYVVDVEDTFWGSRGTLRVESDNNVVRGGQEITVGKGRAGRVRVMVAVPDDAQPGTHAITVVLEDWHKSSGGIGPRMERTTKLELVGESEASGSGKGGQTKGSSGAGGGASSGGNVALRWSNPDQQEDWKRVTVGEVLDTPAHVLAEQRPEYADLAALGDQPIPTLVLNEEYPPFKQYLHSRVKKLESADAPKERYAVGVGVALLLLKQAQDARAEKDQTAADPGEFAEAQQAAARAVLAVMPAFDELAKEAGLDDTDGQ